MNTVAHIRRVLLRITLGLVHHQIGYQRGVMRENLSASLNLLLLFLPGELPYSICLVVLVVASKGHYPFTLSSWFYDCVQVLLGVGAKHYTLLAKQVVRALEYEGLYPRPCRGSYCKFRPSLYIVVLKGLREPWRLGRWKVMTGRVSHLSPVVALHPKTGLVVLVVGRHELGVLLGVAALCGHVVAAIANPAVCAAVREGEVLLVLLSCSGRNDLIHYLWPHLL